MNLIHVRFAGSILAQLAEIRERQARFQRLLSDRRTGIRVRTRTKNPALDLKAGYLRRLVRASAVSTVPILAAFRAFPEYNPAVLPASVPRPIIQIEDIPETVQRRRPPPLERPAVPLAVEDEEVPEDVTIAFTDLDLDRLPVDLPRLPVAPHPAHPPEEEEIVELWKVEEKPELIRRVTPAYPALAQKAGLEGTVYVNLLVGKDGRVLEAVVVNGLEHLPPARPQGRPPVPLQARHPEPPAGQGVGHRAHAIHPDRQRLTLAIGTGYQFN